LKIFLQQILNFLVYLLNITAVNCDTWDRMPVVKNDPENVGNGSEPNERMAIQHLKKDQLQKELLRKEFDANSINQQSYGSSSSSTTSSSKREMSLHMDNDPDGTKVSSTLFSVPSSSSNLFKEVDKIKPYSKDEKRRKTEPNKKEILRLV
jgi:hypothetical protein